MSDGLVGQQVTLATTNMVDDLAYYLKTNQAMNRIGLNKTVYYTDMFSIQARL